MKRKACLRITWTKLEIMAVALALLGRRMLNIEARTGLSPGQVYYRLKLLKLSETRQQFKTNESTVSRRVEQTNLFYAQTIVRHKVHDVNKKLPRLVTRRKAA